MKGLLLKDFYLIRSALYVISACFIVVGASISLLTSTWSLTVVATVMLGMVFVNTINMDKSSGWRKMAGTMPISRQTIIDSKYLMYLLLSGAGFVLGVILGGVTSLIQGRFDREDMLIFSSISAYLSLFAGGITIPLSLRISEEKSMLALIVAYPIAAAVFAGCMFFMDSAPAMCTVALALGVMVYAASWLFARKLIMRMDLA